MDFTVLRVYPGSKIWSDPNNFDVSFPVQDYGFFKGRPGDYKAGVSTSSLSSEEIVEIRERLERKFKPGLWES
mgnify:CR=1 FL=1